MCEVVKELWCNCEIYMNAISRDSILFDVDTVMVNRIVEDKPAHCKKILCLLTKQYIYRQRCFKQIPRWDELKVLIQRTIAVEKFIAIKNKKLSKHNKKWNVKDTTHIMTNE